MIAEEIVNSVRTDSSVSDASKIAPETLQVPLKVSNVNNSVVSEKNRIVAFPGSHSTNVTGPLEQLDAVKLDAVTRSKLNRFNRLKASDRSKRLMESVCRITESSISIRQDSSVAGTRTWSGVWSKEVHVRTPVSSPSFAPTI